MTENTATTAITCEDPTLMTKVISREQLLELQLGSASTMIACTLVGEQLSRVGDLTLGANRQLKRFKDEQLYAVAEELIGAAETRHNGPLQLRELEAMKVALTGLLYMGCELSIRDEEFAEMLKDLNTLVDAAEASFNLS